MNQAQAKKLKLRKILYSPSLSIKLVIIKNQILNVTSTQIQALSRKMISKILMMEKNFWKHQLATALFVSTWPKTKKNSKMSCH